MKTTLVSIAFVLLLLLELGLNDKVHRMNDQIVRLADASNSKAETFRRQVDMVERYTSVATEPSRSGTAAVLYSRELLKTQGYDAAVAYYEKLLPEVRNVAVRRTVQAQMVELYTAADNPHRQPEKAMALLRELITSTPPEPYGAVGPYAVPPGPAGPTTAPAGPDGTPRFQPGSAGSEK